MHACMHVCMYWYVCMYARMCLRCPEYGCMDTSMYAGGVTFPRAPVFLYVFMYLNRVKGTCVYVFMHTGVYMSTCLCAEHL